MNHTIRNLAFAATAIFAATPVLADELLPPGHYEDELARCVAEIRAETRQNRPAFFSLRYSAPDIDGSTTCQIPLATSTVHNGGTRWWFRCSPALRPSSWWSTTTGLDW